MSPKTLSRLFSSNMSHMSPKVLQYKGLLPRDADALKLMIVRELTEVEEKAQNEWEMVKAGGLFGSAETAKVLR